MVIRDYIFLGIFFLIVACVPSLLSNDYYISIFVFASFNCLACIGLSLLLGYAGQISLGHAAFIGIGAYTSGYLTTHFALSPWITILIGVVISIIIAIAVGVPSLKLKGHYLAMATLGFGAILYIVAVAAVDITGGPAGLNNIPPLNLFGLILDTDKKFYFFSWSIVALGLLFALNLINSRVGRGLRALHGSEDAANSIGINTSSYKIQIFIFSAVFSSIAGSLYAHYVTYIDPGPFGIMHSVLLMTMVAVGGMHKIWGAVIGSLLLSLLPEFLSFSTGYFKTFGIEYKPDYDTLVYGIILLSIMLFLPEGIYGGFSAAFKSIKNIVKRNEKEDKASS